MNLECRPEMCCTRLAEKQDAKIRHLRTVAQICRPISSQLRHISTIGKKRVKQHYLLHTSSQYGELPLTSGWDRLAGLGQQISTGFALWLRYCSDFAQRRSTKLCTMFLRLLSWYIIYIHFRKLLPINGILPGAKFTVRPSLAFSYISALGYTVRHSCSVRQPNRGVQQKAPPIFGRAAIMLGIDLKATF